VALKLPHKSKAANALLYNDRHFLFTLTAAHDGGIKLLWEKAKPQNWQNELDKKTLFGTGAVLATLRGSRLQLCVMPAQFLIE